jgi:hypothetical protein
VRVQGKDALSSEAWDPRGCTLYARLRFDSGDQLCAGGATTGRREVFPARQGRQLNPVLFRKAARRNALTTTACLVLSGAVVPAAFKGDPFRQGLHARDTGPLGGAVDESLFATVLKNVSQASHSGVVIRNDNCVEPVCPESMAPVVNTAYLTSDVAVHEANEPGELSGIIYRQQAVPVVAHHHERMNPNRVDRLRPANDADDDVIHLSRRPKEVTTVHGASCNLDERVGWNVTERPRHR